MAEGETKEKDSDADVKQPAKEETQVADSGRQWETVAEMEGTAVCFPALLGSARADAYRMRIPRVSRRSRRPYICTCLYHFASRFGRWRPGFCVCGF